jgi:hypothetical protein
MNPSKPPAAGTLVPDIVKDIPLQTQGGAAAKPANEDDELDRIMHDVGHDIKAIGERPPKKHFDLFGHKNKKPKADPKFHAQPIAVPQQAPARPTAAPAQKPAAKPQSPKTSDAPVLVIFMAMVITGALIAAAYYAYK